MKTHEITTSRGEFVARKKQGDFKWKDDDKKEVEFVDNEKGRFVLVIDPAGDLI